MKKLTAILLAVLLLSTLVACATQAPAPATPASPAPAAPAAPAPAAPAAPAPAAPAEPTNPYDKLDKVYIGVTAPLTGAGAGTARFVTTAIDIWLEDHPEGILGKPVEIVYEDTQHTEAGAAAAYLKLAVRGDISCAIGGQFSNQGLAMLPSILEYKIPTIHQGSSVKFAEAVAAGNRYTYQNRINDQGTGFSMADAIVNVLGAKKIAVIHDSNAFGQGLANNAIAAMKTFGVEPVLVLSYTTSEKQFTGYLSQIKNAGCDGILMMAHPNEAALIQMGVKGAGLQDLIKVGSPDAGAAATIALSGDDCNGWYSIADWVPSTQNEPGKTFAEKYRTKHNMEADMNSTSAYDQMTIFKTAMEKAGSQDPAAIQEALQNLGEVQGTASLYSFNESNIGATTQYLAINENKVPQAIDLIIRADYKKP